MPTTGTRSAASNATSATSFFETKDAYYIVGGGAGAGLLVIILMIVAIVCVMKRRKSSDDNLVYGSALAGVKPSAGASPVINPATVRAATNAAPPPSLVSPVDFRQTQASQFDADGNPIGAAPVVPEVAPPMQGNYGKLPDGPITASPDHAPDIYAEIANVALPGMPGHAPSMSSLPPPPMGAGIAPPRPATLPPPP